MIDQLIKYYHGKVKGLQKQVQEMGLRTEGDSCSNEEYKEMLVEIVEIKVKVEVYLEFISYLYAVKQTLN